jgi:hypothetical protein
MPLETDSGYLPDWLKAILSQQSGASGGGLFSGGDAPAPQNIGLLAGGPPAFTSVNPSDKIKAIAGNVALVRRLYPNLSDQEISAFARNPEMMKQIGQVAAPMEQWSAPYKDSDGNLSVRHLRTGDTKILVKSPDPQLVDLATGKYGPNGQQEFIKAWVGKGENGAAELSRSDQVYS